MDNTNVPEDVEVIDEKLENIVGNEERRIIIARGDP